MVVSTPYPKFNLFLGRGWKFLYIIVRSVQWVNDPNYMKITGWNTHVEPASCFYVLCLYHLPTFSFITLLSLNVQEGRRTIYFFVMHLLFFLTIYIHSFVLVCMIIRQTAIWQFASVTFDFLLLLVLGSYLILLFTFLAITTRVCFRFFTNLLFYF